MRIDNVKIYDIEESIKASGYPMQTTLDTSDITDKDIKRAVKLSKLGREDNPAHSQFLTGIRVSFDLACSNKMWVEAERYRFLEFVSSQSTAHRITKFNLDNSYNEYVDKRIIDIMKEKVYEYNSMENAEERSKKYLEILYSNPSGFELTARMTTNYRCLANIYRQRKDHILPEWRDFCKWIETLPYSKELLIS